MSLRSKTQKAKKFGTPTAPSVSAPKAPSPKQPKIVRTIAPTVTTAPKAVTRPTVQRGAIPQTAAGIAAQAGFKAQLQVLTALPSRQLAALTGQLARTREFKTKDLLQKQIQDKEQEIIDIEHELLVELAEQADIELSPTVNQIISALESGKQVYPDWFHSNIIWVKSGQITNQAFLDSYYHLSNQGIIHSPITEPIIEPIIDEPLIEIPELLPEVSAEPDSSITDNMVTQQVINFNIVNGRAVGSIKFVATNNFNPYYYGHNIVNIIQFKDPNGANILTYVKENRLNFTETERDEVINYDEDMKGNTRATVESFVWSSAVQPTAFSKMYSIEISEAEPPKPITSGFMGAGIAGTIAGLILIGFIADHKRGKP